MECLAKILIDQCHDDNFANNSESGATNRKPTEE